ncbi:MAG: hypothetical protein ABFD25_15745 [Clostridiaceae bacterium]
MKYFEIFFHIFYLTSVFFMSVKMIKSGKDSRIVRLFGYMGFILGFGDSFHLIPRIYALCTAGLEANAAALGIGKAVTSVTMTVFYILLFIIWETRFHVRDDLKLRIWVGILAAARIILSLMPQNQWTLYNAPLDWGIYRNIPFTILGAIIVYILLKDAKKHSDSAFGKIGAAVIISFVCYLPVVLFSNTFRPIGILMIPKTLSYLWVIYVGYKEIR